MHVTLASHVIARRTPTPLSRAQPTLYHHHGISAGAAAPRWRHPTHAKSKPPAPTTAAEAAHCSAGPGPRYKLAHARGATAPPTERPILPRVRTVLTYLPHGWQRDGKGRGVPHGQERREEKGLELTYSGLESEESSGSPTTFLTNKAGPREEIWQGRVQR